MNFEDFSQREKEPVCHLLRQFAVELLELLVGTAVGGHYFWPYGALGGNNLVYVVLNCLFQKEAL